MLNIFLTHTPFHVYVAQCIIRCKLLPSDAINILLIEYEADYSQMVDHKLWADIISLEVIGGSTIGHARYKKCEKNVDLIKSIINGDKNIQIFMSDIAWPMNNRIYFDKQLRRRVDYCLYPDGLGTYVLSRVTKALYARGMIKSLNGLIKQGVRYKNYKGTQAGIDRKETKYVYAPNINFVECEASKKIEVPFNLTGEISLDMSKCLFLDQPVGWGELNSSELYLIREAAINSLKSLNAKRYYYKNHHFGREKEEVYFENQGFSIINSNICAEQIVRENGFGIVVSYQSSALFNLKCMYKDKIRCISLFSRIHSMANGYNENKSSETLDILNKVNVELIKIP